MPTNYPNSLDTFPSSTTLATHTLSTDPHSVLHGNLGDALSALEIKVGINSSVVTSSLDHKVSHLLTRQVIAGSGLSGGGDLSSDVTLSLPNVGTANTYGDSTHYPIITTDSQGRISSVSTQLVQGGVSSFNTRTGAITLTTTDVDAALPADVVQTDIANTFIVGSQTIQTGADVNKGLIVKANSVTQSANLQEWQDSSGNAKAKIRSDGSFEIGIWSNNGGALFNIDLGVGGVALRNVGGVPTIQCTVTDFSAPTPLQYYASKHTFDQGDFFGPFGYDFVICSHVTFGARLNIGNNSPLVQNVIIRGAPSQAANLQEWQDSSPSVLSAILPNGSWSPPSISDSNATNNSLYYSTTQSKLVFKDSGGTANPLY